MPPSESGQSEHAGDQHKKTTPPDANSALWLRSTFRSRSTDDNGRFRLCNSAGLFFDNRRDNRRPCSGALNPIPDHLPLLRRQPDKLKTASKPRLVTHQGASPDRYANIRKPQFERNGLARGHFSGHDRTHPEFADVG